MRITSSAQLVLRKLGLINLARRLWCAVSSRKRGIKISYQREAIRVRREEHEILIGRNHEVYLNDMILFFDYYFSAVVPEQSNGHELVDYSHPRLHRLRRSQVEFEFPALPESDESTDMYLSALGLTEGEVVFDLGAYAGASTYFFAKAVGPQGVVAAFEPDPTSLAFLRSNVVRHSLSNVQVFDCGIWSANTTLMFQSEGNMGSSVAKILKRDSHVRATNVVTLDEAARRLGGRRVAGIKMDVEGAEVEVLKSAGEFLRDHRPRLVVEPHFVDGVMTTGAVSEMLSAYGYNVEVLSQGSQDWPLVAARPQ